jgi:uncharacterized protein
MPNPFVHIELHTGDVDKAKDFYSGLMDWKLEDMDMGPMTYTMVHVGEDGVGGGMVAKQSDDAPTAWMPYVNVDDLDASTEKVKSLGGTILAERQEVPNMGSFAIIADPTGATIGLWQPADAS